MSSARQGMPRVELHGYDDPKAAAKFNYVANVDKAFDITVFVKRLRWSHTLTAPWESITLELSLPRRHWFEVLPGRSLQKLQNRTLRTPETGFWVVLWSPDSNAPNGESAVAWGHCTSLSVGGMVRNGALLETLPVTIQCGSWCELVGKSQIGLAVKGWGREGFVYRLNSWFKNAKALVQSLTTNEPGDIFQQLWYSLVRVTLPTTLVSNDGKPLEIGQEIPIVFNLAQAQEFAPLRANQQLEVPGYAINSFASFCQPGGGLLEMFLHTFQADPNIVEIFPSLEWPCYLPIDGQPKNSPLKGTLGAALNAQPVLIYRLKPYLLAAIAKEPLQALLPKTAEDGRENVVPSTASEALGAFQNPARSFLPVAVKWYEFGPSEITEFSPQWSDDDRINCVTVQSPLQPQSQIEFLGLMNTPQIDTQQVGAHGFREYKVDWPFLPAVIPDNDPKGRDTLTQRINSLTEMAYMIIAGGESYCSAKSKTLYKPWVKAGHWVELHLTKEKDSSPMHLTGYLQGVTHDIVADEGVVVTANTELDIVRGTLSDKSNTASVKIPPGGGHPGGDKAADQVRGTPPDVVFAGVTQPAAPQKEKDSQYITPHFKWTDLDPLNARTPTVEARLRKVAEALEKLRALCGDVPLLVTGHGGYQPSNVPVWKADKNGNRPKDAKPDEWPPREKTSQHRLGYAADVVIKGAPLSLLQSAALAMYQTGEIRGFFVYDSSFVHIDLRPGPKATKDSRKVKTPIKALKSGQTPDLSLNDAGFDEVEEADQELA